jgi:C4-dicarboxylate-specific signal transduction histidine kinase
MSKAAEMIRVLELVEAMLESDPDPSRHQALVQGEWLAATGVLAGSVAADLSGPLLRVREILGEIVDLLDRHAASARGPKPLPHPAVLELRRSLADAFLLVGRVSRLAADLSAVASPPSAAESSRALLDVNQVVERAVSLVRRRLTEDCEVFVDLGRVPAARADLRALTQALTQLLFVSAYLSPPHGSLSVKTSTDVQTGEAMVTIVHEIPEGAERPMPFREIIRRTVEAQGGKLTIAPPSAEIRLPPAT